MSRNNKPPKLGEDSFSCPHCDALAHQSWYQVHIKNFEDNTKPWIPNEDNVRQLELDNNLHGEHRDKLIAFYKLWSQRKVFSKEINNDSYYNQNVMNVYFSCCYSCKEFTIWVADRIAYPLHQSQIQPNEDMPFDIKIDFTEAASIVDHSPRAASALLRLCLQKLMILLGLKGQNLHNDIGELVKRGLDPRIQKACDVVRVIGNNAVHPGEISIQDDAATAKSLFDLVNVIVEETISKPKHIEQMYQNLPEGALKAIEKRDGSKTVEI